MIEILFLCCHSHHPELVGHSQQLVWSNERGPSNVDSLASLDPEEDNSWLPVRLIWAD